MEVEQEVVCRRKLEHGVQQRVTVALARCPLVRRQAAVVRAAHSGAEHATVCGDGAREAFCCIPVSKVAQSYQRHTL